CSVPGIAFVYEASLNERDFARTKSRELFDRRGRRRLWSVLGEKFVLAASVVPRIKTSRILARSSGSARPFHVRSALARWRLCSRLHTLLIPPLPLLLRLI